MLMTKEDGTPEDFCVGCREKSRQEYSYSYDHEYEHQGESDGLSRNSRRGYYYDFYDG